MRTSELYVVFYRPQFGNYQHWALYLQTDNGDHIIFQVVGSHGTFQAEAIRKNPTASRGYLSQTLLTTINSEELSVMQQVIQNVYVDNETIEWDCQDYVLEILDALEVECIVDEEDEDYQYAKEGLKQQRGPVA